MGIELKVISAIARTVAALVKQAGLPNDIKLVSGPELAAMSPAEFDQERSSDYLRAHFASRRKTGRFAAAHGHMWR